MPRVRCVLFDFFATLVHYDEARRLDTVERTLNTLQRLGIAVTPGRLRELIDEVYAPFDAEAAASLREYHTDAAMTALLKRLGSTPDKQTVRELSHAWIDDWRQNIAPPAGLANLLAGLQRPLWVVSNTSTPWSVDEILREQKLLHLFQGIVTSVEAGWRKPNHQIYAEALRRADFQPEEVLFVGDNPACDYHGPRAFGMQALLLSAQPPVDVPATHCITTLNDLLSNPLLAD